MLTWVFVAFAGFFVLESVAPGWRMPRVRTCPVRANAIDAAQLGVVMLAGVTRDRWLQRASMLDYCNVHRETGSA